MSKLLFVELLTASPALAASCEALTAFSAPRTFVTSLHDPARSLVMLSESLAR